MLVINNEPHMIVATFDGRIDIRLRPGDTAEVESAKRVDVRPITAELGASEHQHRSLYSTLREEPLAYKLDDDIGDGR